MKKLTIRRKIAFVVPDEKQLNLKQTIDSMNRALKIWALTQGLEPTGDGVIEFDLIEVPKLQKKTA